jgi:hypothetical protein
LLEASDSELDDELPPVSFEERFSLSEDNKTLFEASQRPQPAHELEQRPVTMTSKLVQQSQQQSVQTPSTPPTLTPTGSFTDPAKPFRSFIPQLKVRTNSIDDAIRRKVSQIKTEELGHLESGNAFASELFSSPVQSPLSPSSSRQQLRSPSLSLIPRSNSFKSPKTPTSFSPSPLSATVMSNNNPSNSSFTTPTTSSPNSPRFLRPTLASTSKQVQEQDVGKPQPKRRSSLSKSTVPEYLLRPTVSSAGKIKPVPKTVNEPVLPQVYPTLVPKSVPVVQTSSVPQNTYATTSILPKQSSHSSLMSTSTEKIVASQSPPQVQQQPKQQQQPQSILHSQSTEDASDQPKPRSRSNSIKGVRFGGTQAYYYHVPSESEEALPGSFL